MSRWKRLLAGFLSLLVAIFVISCYQLATNPQGKYLEDKIGYTGLSYFEFKGGQVFLVLSRGYDRLGGQEDKRAMVGTHFYRNGKWMMNSVEGNELLILETGLFSIRWVDASGQVQYEIPRLINIGDRVFRIYSP